MPVDQLLRLGEGLSVLAVSDQRHSEEWEVVEELVLMKLFLDL